MLKIVTYNKEIKDYGVYRFAIASHSIEEIIVALQTSVKNSNK